MKTSQTGIDLIKKYEGFSATVYKCLGGYDTIGYGHVLTRHELSTNKFKTITREQAEQILKQDLQTAENALKIYVNRSLTQGQFDALVSFIYNLGSGNFRRSTLRKVVNQENDMEVPSELIRWRMVSNQILRGLLRRRLDESLLWLS